MRISASYTLEIQKYFPNSDGLGLLTLKADGRRRVHGARPWRVRPGVPVVLMYFGGEVPRWLVDGVSVSRWCLSSVVS